MFRLLTHYHFTPIAASGQSVFHCILKKLLERKKIEKNNALTQNKVT